ncbi:hypothetical protein [Conexibacter woesei]|uniref:hypothetical protein n=1 Tax=Conexibacter woesei TaxID=191495 RepID=UPI001E618351|nr:hypothetical protein [Conexibacter woesei]
MAALVAVAVPLALVLSLLAPQPAEASCSMDFSFSITDCAKDAAGTVISKTFDMLFGGIQASVTQVVLTYLTAIPSFAHDGNIEKLSDLTTALAFGALGAVMTISIIRYWLSGLSLSGQGGAEAVEGFTRSIWAALMILAWPWVFDQAVAIFNSATAGIMGAPSVQDDLKNMFRDFTISTFVPGPSMIISLIAELAGVFALLGLLWMKISLTAGTAFLRIAMPVAIVLWPIDEFAWLSRTAAKAMFTCLVVPLIWALLFATFAALGISMFNVPTDGNGWLDQLVRPLAADAILISAITIPKNLLKAAYQPGGGGGRSGLGSIATYLAMRQAAGMFSRGGGGSTPSPTVTAEAQDPLRATAERIYPNRTALPGRRALPAGGMPAIGGPGGGPSPGGGGGGGGGGPRPGGPGTGPGGGRGRGPGGGTGGPHDGRRHGGPRGRNGSGPGARPNQQPPRFDQARASQFQQRMQAVSPQQGPSVSQVSDAQSALSDSDQWRLWSKAETTGGKVQPLAAQMMAEYGRDQASQRALYTIGSASIPTRNAGMSQPTTPRPSTAGDGASEPMRATRGPDGAYSVTNMNNNGKAGR